MSGNNINWTRLAAGAYAAKRGVDVYHDTGDPRAAIRTGTDLLGALWLICLGVSIILLCAFLSMFTLSFLLGVLVGAILTGLGVHILRRTLRRANVASLPQAPPSIP